MAVAILFVQYEQQEAEEGGSHGGHEHEHATGHGSSIDASHPVSGPAHHGAPPIANAPHEEADGAPRSPGHPDHHPVHLLVDDEPTDAEEQAGWDKEFGSVTTGWGRSRKWLRDNIIYRPEFFALTMTCVVLNTIFLIIPFHGISDAYALR